jgi:predicted PurR-regulated permease PerM
MERERQRRITLGFLTLLFALWVAYLLQPYGATLFAAVFLGYVFYPVYHWLLKKSQRKNLSALLTLLLIFLIVILPLFSLLGVLAREALTSLEVLAGRMEVSTLGDRLSSLLTENPQLEGEIQKLAGEIAQRFVRALSGTIGAVSGALLHLIFLAFVTFYVLVDGSRLCTELRRFIPLETGQFDLLLENVARMIHALVYGQIVVAFIQGLLGGIGFFLFGIPSPVFWGFVMVLFSFIPFVGAFLIWLPAGIYELLTGDVFSGVGVLLWGAIVVSQVDNLLRPRLVSGRAQVHPLVIFLGVFGGAVRYGLIGIILGPIILSLFVALLEPYERVLLGRKARGDEEREEAPVRAPGR